MYHVLVSVHPQGQSSLDPDSHPCTLQQWVEHLFEDGKVIKKFLIHKTFKVKRMELALSWQQIFHDAQLGVYSVL